MQTSSVFCVLFLQIAIFLSAAATASAQLATQEQREQLTDYVRWLEERSMLHQAREQADQISGSGVQWRHPYGDPRPREAVKTASVWLLDYPGSVITRPGKSVIATWGEPELWQALEHIGIELLHTGPVKRAGGIHEREYTPTVDGWFDPISINIDPDLGTDRKSTRLNSSHSQISYAVFCLKKKKK